MKSQLLCTLVVLPCQHRYRPGTKSKAAHAEIEWCYTGRGTPGIEPVYAKASIALKETDEPRVKRYIRLMTLFASTLSMPRLA